MLLLALVLSATLIWLPAILWPFTISWDEHTFLLVGQRIASGELPYTTTFDNKSPLANVPHALGLLLVGNDYSLLRFCSALLSGLTAFTLAQVAPGGQKWLPAYLVGALFLLLWATRVNGLVWMTEVNVVFVFSVAMLVAVKKRVANYPRAFLSGLLIGIVPLIRINWGFAALALLAYALIQASDTRLRVMLMTSAALPTLAVTSLYAVTGNLKLLWAGAIQLPFLLGEADPFRLPNLADDQLPRHWLMAIMYISALSLTAIAFRRQRRAEIRLDVLILAISWALTAGALFQPFDFPYQVLQIIPFVVLATGRVLNLFGTSVTPALIPLGFALVGLSLALISGIYAFYDWRNQSRSEEAIVEALSRVDGVENKTLWVPDDTHYLYWRLKSLPPTPLASFPWLVWADGSQRAFSGEVYPYPSATQQMFDLTPGLIVARDSFSGSFYGDEASSDVWRQRLSSEYRQLTTIGDVVVWERITQDNE